MSEKLLECCKAKSLFLWNMILQDVNGTTVIDLCKFAKEACRYLWYLGMLLLGLNSNRHSRAAAMCGVSCFLIHLVE